MKKILIIINKSFKILLRKKWGVLVPILVPGLSIILAFMINGYKVENIKVGICDLDGTAVSREFIQKIDENEKITMVKLEKDSVNTFVANSSVHMGIIIPVNFQRDIIDQKLKDIHIISVKDNDATFWIKETMDLYLSGLNKIAKISQGKSDDFFRIYDSIESTNIQLKNKIEEDKSLNIERSVQSIGFMCFFMLLTSVFNSQYIIKDRSSKIHRRIRRTNITRMQYFLGNLLFILSINIVEIIIFSFIAITGALNYYMRLWIVITMMMLFAVISSALAVFGASYAKEHHKIYRVINLVIVFSCGLGGCIWPLYLMPEEIQKISLLLPQGWIMKTLHEMQVRNVYSSLGINFIVLIIYSILLLGLAYTTWGWKKDVHKKNLQESEEN